MWGLSLNKTHANTLDIILRNPVATTLEWHRIESLFKAIGAVVIEGRGSRVKFELKGVIATFHRPHPQKEAKPYQVRGARDFLKQTGYYYEYNEL
jgi:hypothetical protein